MTRTQLLLPLCLAILHTPDGGELRIDTRHITAVRPAQAVKAHLAAGTETVIYTGTQTFGVTEKIEEVQAIVDECVGEGNSE